MFIFFALFILAVITLSSLRYYYLQAAAVFMMLSVTMLGQKFFEIYGLTSNYGNIFFSGVIYSIILAYYTYGEEEAAHIVKIMFFILFFFICCVSILLGLPYISSSQNVQSAMQTLFQPQFRIIVASFCSFYFVQQILFLLMRKIKHAKIIFFIPLLCLLIQAIDSSIFFPIAFYGVFSNIELLHTAFSGFIVKSVISIFSTPFFFLASKMTKRI